MTQGVLDVSGLVAAAESHLLSVGLFDAVNWHEPKKAPGVGVTAAVWLMATSPVPARSGLAVTTVRVELRVRLYIPMLREPLDAIDPDLMRALDTLMATYSADFTLGGLADVDLLGAYGAGLISRTGHLEVDKRMHRVADITLPLIVNDLWAQVP